MKMRPLGAELLHADRRTEGRQTDRHDKVNLSKPTGYVMYQQV